MAEDKKPAAGHLFQATTGEGDKAVTKKYRTKLAIFVIPGFNEGKPVTSLELSKNANAQKALLEITGQTVAEEVA